MTTPSAPLPPSRAREDGHGASSLPPSRAREGGQGVRSLPPSRAREGGQGVRSLHPIIREVAADLETPVSAYLKLARGPVGRGHASSARRPYGFLLESVEGGERVARYSFVGADPYMVLCVRDGQAERRWLSGPRAGAVERVPCADPLEAVRAELERRPIAPVAGLPRFAGGAVGYLAYEAVTRYEPTVPVPSDDPLGVPEAVYLFSDTLLVFDHARHTALLLTYADPNATNGDEERARAVAESRLDDMERRLHRAAPRAPLAQPPQIGFVAAKSLGAAATVGALPQPAQAGFVATRPLGAVSTAGSPNADSTAGSPSADSSAGSRTGADSSAGSRTGADSSAGSLPLPAHGKGARGLGSPLASREAYEAAVLRVQEYVRAGDCFQVVPSRRLARPTRAHPFDIYRALRSINPSPYMFYLALGDFAVAGASPELLVRVERGEVAIHPIAGTRRRAADPAEDAALEAELRADPKERAEHVMLVDLGRNDVGRVAEPGSVRVTQFLDVERYSHVMHLVSHVTGHLRADLTPYDALRAGFPAGTLTGAPKVRAMQIIAELEQQRRGVYGGAVGYLGFDGNLDTCIAIRTLVLKDGVAYAQAGGGIVADSEPAAEYAETENKLGAVLRALEVAEARTTASPSKPPKRPPRRKTTTPRTGVRKEAASAAADR